ncbi:hypothetical protein D3C76_1563310 [compost metagenome]
MGQALQIQATDHRHHRHQQLALFATGQQGLEHLRRLKIELLRRFQAVGRSFGVMFVTVDMVFGANLFQQIQGGRHAGLQTVG